MIKILSEFFWPKQFLGQKVLGQQHFLVKNFVSKKIWVKKICQQNFWSKMIYVKKFVSFKCSGQKNVKTKKCWGQKIFGEKKIGVKKEFWSKKPTLRFGWVAGGVEVLAKIKGYTVGEKSTISSICLYFYQVSDYTWLYLIIPCYLCLSEAFSGYLGQYLAILTQANYNCFKIVCQENFGSKNVGPKKFWVKNNLCQKFL